MAEVGGQIQEEVPVENLRSGDSSNSHQNVWMESTPRLPSIVPWNFATPCCAC